MKAPKKNLQLRLALAKIWDQWRVPIIAAVILVAVGVAATVFMSKLSERSAQAELQERETTRQALQTEVKAGITGLFEELARLADAADLSELIAAGDDALIQARADAMAAGNEKVLRVRLLRPEQLRVDYALQPPLSYAGLDLLQRAAASEKSPAPEVHLFGKPGQHLALVVRLTDEEGGVTGLVMVQASVESIGTALKQVSFPGGYAELRQPVVKSEPVVLWRQGQPQAGAPEVGRVPGTAWELVFSLQEASLPEADEGMPIWPLAALLVLVLAGAVVFLKRRGGKLEATGAHAVFGGAAAGVPSNNLDALVDAIVSRPDEPPKAPEPEPEFEPPEDEGDIDLDLGFGDGAEEPSNTPAAVPGASPPPANAPEAGGMPEAIFRAYDIRGVVGKTLTPEIVYQIGQAIGSEAYELGRQTVCVARDGRLSGPELSEALIRGLRESGRDVIDIGQGPTPLLYFGTHFLETASGVMLTGSHNPPDYNGLKIVLDGVALSGDRIKALYQRIQAGKFSVGEGNLQQMDIGHEYIMRVTEDIPVALGNAYNIVVDCGNGVAGALAPQLYKAMGHDVQELYCEVDGNFPNHHPDPSQPDNLVDLISKVKESGADLGFAFDGDGDRLGVVDNEGNVIWGDRLLMLYARDVLSRNPGGEIIYDIKSSNQVKTVIEEAGGKALMWKTGHSLIKAKMKEDDALLAAEMSGHIFFKERWYGFDDALYAGARLLEILLNDPRRPAEVFADLPQTVATPELQVQMSEGAHHDFMQRFSAEASFEGADVATIDGVRADFEDGWGLVRASNTTPVLVLRFEGRDEAALERVKTLFKDQLLALDASLQLPF